MWEVNIINCFSKIHRHQIHHNKQRLRPETKKKKTKKKKKRWWIGKDFRSLEMTFTPQPVSQIVIRFSTFQTHIKVLQLYLRLQDRFYTHHRFVTFLTFLRFKMFASMSVQNKAAILFFSSFGCYI